MHGDLWESVLNKIRAIPGRSMRWNREGIVGTYEITQSWPGIVFSTHVTGGKSQERMKIRDSRDSMRETRAVEERDRKAVRTIERLEKKENGRRRVARNMESDGDVC